MAGKLSPAPYATRVLREGLDPNSDAARQLAADFQFDSNAYDAAERVALANDQATAAAARLAGPGFDIFASVKGWPYR